MKKTRRLMVIAVILAMLTVIGLFTQSSFVKSAYAAYHGGCYYCDDGECKCYNGAGGAFCTNNPCRIRLLCLPAS